MDNECSSSSHCPTLPSDPYGTTDSVKFGAGVDVPAIFLSHSGRQKNFVEHLYNALKSANHTAFFDKHTLPKASPFAVHIEQAARGCRLGVVVVSDAFFTSKWPMLELEMLVLERGPDALVLPLFYKLQPSDLKAPDNLSRWRSVWKEKGGEHADQWEKAVQTLDSFNGEVFVRGSSKIAYISKVVHRICALVPCNVPYSLCFIQGHQRLVEEISKMFEQAKDRNSEQSSCMVGLHGVGGLGKTTLCKSMVNFYTTQYLGRSCLIEFPSDGNESKITQECKRALKQLTDLSDEPLLNVGDDFDKAIHLMKKHMRGHNVFLAIDNVWESSREKAEKLLHVRFSGTSKILLTSRSKLLLQTLLAEKTNTSYIINSLPALKREEAFQIFQKSAKLGDLRSLVDKNQIDRVLKRCWFNGDYHALALKALAQYVCSVCALTDSGELKERLTVILEEISNSDLESVEKVIMLSYKSLPLHKKHMFLDIAHLEMMKSKIMHQEIEEQAYRPKVLAYKPEGLAYASYLWLYRLYTEFSKSTINGIIYELALDGLIEIGAVDADGRKMIGVHDLYLDFARREAANSPRFFTEASLTKLVENNIEWGRLKRVFLLGPHENNKNLHSQEHRELHVSLFLEKLQQQECGELQVLVVVCGGSIGRMTFHLDCMPTLRVLTVHATEFSRQVRGEERSLVVRKMRRSPCQLQVLSLKHNWLTKIADLDSFQKLQMLDLFWCVCLEKIDGLSGLVRLEALNVSFCERLKKLPDLSGLMCLRSLMLLDNQSLNEVGRLSSALKHVFVKQSPDLKKVPDVSGLTCVETLELHENYAMEEVGGVWFSSTLKFLSITDCPKLRRFPSWSGCVHLQELRIFNSLGDLRNAGVEKLVSLRKLKLRGVRWSSNHLMEDARVRHCRQLEFWRTVEAYTGAANR